MFLPYNSILNCAALALRSLPQGLRLLIPVLLCASFAQGAVSGYDQTASEKLEVVKRALVDLALESEVKLGTSAYLDGQGVLHESSILSTDMKVRGVRVLSYLKEAGITVAKVDGSILSNPSCPGSRTDSRREARVRIIYSLPNEAVGDHHMSELAQFSEQMLHRRLSTSKQWSTRPERAYDNSYQRYVSGSSSDQVPYRLDIRLSEAKRVPAARRYLARSHYVGLQVSNRHSARATAQLPTRVYQQPWPSRALEYELVLVDRVTDTPLWRKKLPLSYPAVARGYSKDTVPLKFQQNVAAATDQFIIALNDALDCQPEAYQLSALAGDTDKASINAGLIVGLAVGDQFLISADANILDEVLSLSGLAGLALAEVESVSRHSATIKHIAGLQWPSAAEINNAVALHF